jgi:hypothetical protein
MRKKLPASAKLDRVAPPVYDAVSFAGIDLRGRLRWTGAQRDGISWLVFVKFAVKKRSSGTTCPMLIISPIAPGNRIFRRSGSVRKVAGLAG